MNLSINLLAIVDIGTLSSNIGYLLLEPGCLKSCVVQGPQASTAR